MNKKFLQSLATGIATLSLVASCSHFGMHKESNTCGAKNGCAGKKDEAHKCSAKEAHKCGAKSKCSSKEAHKCAAAKKAKKAEVKAETKAEEKKN